MKSTMSVQVDSHVLLKLMEQLQRRGGAQDLSEVMTSAIELWMAEQAKLSARADPVGVFGYQWKSLFLPEGTVLRSWSYGEHNYARVERDQIIHQGRAVTPNQFAQFFARTTRNAWTDLYIRRPADKQFKLASRLRQEQQAQASADARAVAPGAQPDAAMLALLAAMRPQLPVTAIAASAEAAAPAPRRECAPAPGWNLPERRKYRYRIEDVAFD